MFQSFLIVVGTLCFIAGFVLCLVAACAELYEVHPVARGAAIIGLLTGFTFFVHAMRTDDASWLLWSAGAFIVLGFISIVLDAIFL